MESKPIEEFPNFDPEDAIYMAKIRDILEAFPHKGPPMEPTELLPHVYIGNQRNANDIDQLKAIGINYVLNMAGTRQFDLNKSPYAREDGIKGFLMIPSEDHDEYQIIRDFPAAHEFLDEVKKKGGKCLVHCNLGVNRCGAICASYILVDQRRTLLKTFQYLKNKRTVILCNKAFQHQIIRFARLRELIEPLTSAESLQVPKAKVNNTEQNGVNGQENGASKQKSTNSSNDSEDRPVGYPFDILYPKSKRKAKYDSLDVLTDTSYISDVVDDVINKNDPDSSRRIYRTSSEQCVMDDDDMEEPFFSDDYDPPARRVGRRVKKDSKHISTKNGYERKTPNWMSEVSASVTKMSSPSLKRSAYMSKKNYDDDDDDDDVDGDRPRRSPRTSSEPMTLAGARHLLRESSKRYLDTMFSISKLYNDASCAKTYDDHNDYDLKYKRVFSSPYSERIGDYLTTASTSSIHRPSYRFHDSDTHSPSQKSNLNHLRVTESPRKHITYSSSPSAEATKLAELNLFHRQKARHTRRNLIFPKH